MRRTIVVLHPLVCAFSMFLALYEVKIYGLELPFDGIIFVPTFLQLCLNVSIFEVGGGGGGRQSLIFLAGKIIHQGKQSHSPSQTAGRYGCLEE
jgi:hypothetical protein